MTDQPRETRLLAAIGTMADTLVEDYDVIDVAQLLVDASQDLFDVTAAGLLLSDKHGELELLASTDEDARLMEMLQIDAHAGPCFDCFHTGQLVVVPDISTAVTRWRPFSDAAARLGYASVHAIPLRNHDVVLGTLNLFGSTAGALDAADLLAARALCDMTTLGILHHRLFQEHDIVQAQLENALESRVVIEQPKGFLSFTNTISVDDAFALLRHHARSNSLRISDVARQVIDRSLDLGPSREEPRVAADDEHGPRS
ncbi:GAF and ANTAR domain-containing protein [Clavibacter californiensis]|uniref:ANTAR domain-containing protein n=1 Tax=Clavibacter californiensis TaxID=1401995 RepID=A0ABX9N8T7_9MICO|nr:GAF and ANTAR domain-containing protein [Clavibacter californiensis]RII94052.1 ANTAR domain-containing protein [Clavibacter californiensis]UKF80586.1 GAF and ANTAR domain-containing protein [Clavibacter californiensis]